MSVEEHFAKIRERERQGAIQHKRSVIINQLERVKVGLNEAGAEDDVLEDYEVLETIVGKLMDEAWGDQE